MTTLRTRVRHALKGALRKGGFELKRRRGNFHYVPDYYGRSFAQREDIRATPIFSDLAKQVLAEGRSCLYYDRLYVLFQALTELRRYAQTVRPFRIVEVGVYKGGTTAYLASAAAALGLTDAEVHAFDTFEGHAAVDVDRTHDTFHQPGDFADTSYEGVSAFLQPYPRVHLYKGRFADRCDQLGAGPIALMHLDVDLYAPTLHALEFADARLVPGGICIVDDYEVKNCPGVKSAIQDFLARHPRYMALHPFTEQCVLVRLGAP